MRLWLLRHGEAERQARSDAERPLTPQGRREVLYSAARLRGKTLGAILASPYVRAQQSAELVREALGFTEPIDTVPWLTPDCDPREVLRQLDRLGATELLLVGHQPLLGNLAGLLVEGHREAPLAMRTASLAELEGEMPVAGLMQLSAVLHPFS